MNAVQRYRRMKTIICKAVDTANLCGLKINVLVYDPKFHRLKEHYTEARVKLEAMHLLA